MRSGRLLALLLFLLSIGLASKTTDSPPKETDDKDTKSKGEAPTSARTSECTEDEKKVGNKCQEGDKTKPDTTCAPPAIVVLIFTAYGCFLVYLYIYGFRQWIVFMEAKVKLRKLMALEIALINYDEFCERHGLHGRRELFIPASNDGFFIDPKVQEAWLSVNNLRKQVMQVPTHAYQHIMRSNWDIVKRQKQRDLKIKKNRKEKEQKENKGNEGDPELHLDMIIEGLLNAPLFETTEPRKMEDGCKEGGEALKGDGEEEKKGDGDIKVDAKDDKKEEKNEENKEEKKEENKDEKKDEKKEEKKDEKKEGKKEEKKEEKKEVKKEAKKDK